MTFLHFCAVCSLASILTQTNATPNQDGYTLQLDLIMDSARQARQLVDSAYLRSRQNLKTRMRRETPRIKDMMAFSKQPVGTTRRFIRSADYLDMTMALMKERLKHSHPQPFNISDVLTEEQKEILSQLTGCAYQYLPKICNNSPYRTINGECNNRINPTLGAANTPFKRLLPPEYEDGTQLPRGWTENLPINNFTLPKVREVSEKIAKYSTNLTRFDENRSIVFMQFAQWADHDSDLSPDSPIRQTFFQGADCDNTCVKEYPCFPIPIPVNDSRYDNGSKCLPMVRSAPACNLVTPVRQQINVLTSFLDGSMVYGSDAQTANKLRNHTSQLGLLAINQNYTEDGLALLPFSDMANDSCSITNQTYNIPCFIAGDVRASEQPGLTVMHTLWMREHNRIATELHKLNPKWTSDRLYQESRKILGASMQIITYKQWLPLLMGDTMSTYIPKFTSYNESEDPSVSHSFAICYRLGHTFVHPFYYKYDKDYLPYQPHPVLPLSEGFFTSWRFVKQGGVETLLRGMLINKAKLNRQYQIMVDDLREHLYQTINLIGFDLAALNMQRARDHGLPAYNKWRRYCGLSAPQNVDELAEVLENRELAEKLIDLYGTPENMDVWIVGVCEPLVPGGRIGKLFACIIGERFRSGRNGDRFYYENPSVFSKEQRAALEKVTLSHFICANTNLKEVPLNVFLGNSYPKDFHDCKKIPKLDLKPWKDKGEHNKKQNTGTGCEDN